MQSLAIVIFGSLLHYVFLKDESMSTQSPPMEIVLPSLLAPELRVIRNWCVGHLTKFPAFSKWLIGTIDDELDGRSNPGREPGMLRLPDWTPGELGHALMAVYILARLPITPGMAAFIDLLEKHITCESAAMLEHLDPYFVQQSDSNDHNH